MVFGVGVESLFCAIGGDSECGRGGYSVAEYGDCCDSDRGGGTDAGEGADAWMLSRPDAFSCWMTVAVICDRTSGDRYDGVEALLWTAELTASLRFSVLCAYEDRGYGSTFGTADAVGLSGCGI